MSIVTVAATQMACGWDRDANVARAEKLLREAAVLLGNSSSGIIEAASFGTPVIDIGPRQKGRERGANVMHFPYDRDRLTAHMLRIWNEGRPRRYKSGNIYGRGSAGQFIAGVLANLPPGEKLLGKLISY